MIWFFYNVLFAIGYVLMLPKFFLRMKNRGGYRKGFLQRLGVYSDETKTALKERKRIWVHAVSVGEVHIALCFMDGIRRVKPDAAFVLTVTTSTGHRIAAQRLNNSDVLLYFPVDFPVVVNRVLDLLNTGAIVLTESEIWPNLIRLASNRNIPVMLINGRISESSCRGYRLLRPLFKKTVGNMSLLLVQTEGDADRLIRLGADGSKVRVMGSAKYDIDGGAAGGSDLKRVFEFCGIQDDDIVIAGGSTWPGEEKILLDVFSRLKAGSDKLKLILVPRHAERREEVEAEIKNAGHAYIRRSEINPSGGQSGATDVLLVDTTGELMRVYERADIVFVGKSLTCHGGQNIIEPAVLGKPVITGPYLENFPVIAEDFKKADAIIQVADGDELYARMLELIQNPELRGQFGLRAKQVVESGTGVVERSIREIMSVIIDVKRVT